MTETLIDLTAAITALAAIGVGLWWIDPAYSLIGVGGVVLIVTLLVRLRRPSK